MAAGPCLGDDTIAALLEGRLADGAAHGARDHIVTCDACRRLVSAAVAGSTDGPRPAIDTAGSTQPGFASVNDVAPGSVLAGKYRLERVLGEGGMGRVFAARQVGLERPVAVKVLRPEVARDPTALRRFQREARLVASLASDHVVRVHDLGEMPGGEPFLVMELLDGEDLATIVARGPVPVEVAVAWVVAACDAIGEAHALGMVHRDLKPSNLFLTRAQRIKVLDFGLAKLALPEPRTGESMTATGVMLGSPRYMAPEQIVGARAVDARADVWSLGATLLHLATGRPPFADVPLDAAFANILAGQLPPLDGLSPAIADVIRRALARDPALRFASAAELASALRGTTPAVRARRGSRVALAIGGVAVAAGIATVGFVAGRSGAAAPAEAKPPPETVAAAVEHTDDAPPPTGSADSRTATAPKPVDHTVRGSADSPATAERHDPPGLAALPTGSGSNVVVGHNVFVGRPAVATPTPLPSAGTGPLGNLDESRLRARLAALGWKVTEADHQQFPGCNYTRLQATRGEGWADLTLFQCETREEAAWHGKRLRSGFPTNWIVDDGTLCLAVASNVERGFPVEKHAKALMDALLKP